MIKRMNTSSLVAGCWFLVSDYCYWSLVTGHMLIERLFQCLINSLNHCLFQRIHFNAVAQPILKLIVNQLLIFRVEIFLFVYYAKLLPIPFLTRQHEVLDLVHMLPKYHILRRYIKFYFLYSQHNHEHFLCIPD